MDSFIKRLYKIIEDNETNDNDRKNLFKELNIKDSKEKEENSKFDFTITKSQAKEIVRKDNTLKNDFCKNTERENITFIGFNDVRMDVIEKEGRKYWQCQVRSAEISCVDYEGKETTFCDGDLGENDFKLLRCLIDVQTGEYIYYPEIV